MKITIDGDEYPFVKIANWTYFEAATVKRVAELTVGQVQLGVLRGDAMASFAFAVVGFMRQHPDRDPAELREKEIDEIVVDFREADDADPPAGAGEPGDKKKSRPKS
jgi:hypothetical protein